MRKLLFLLLLGMACDMTRGLATVQRQSVQFGRPFRGLAEQFDPQVIPPNYAGDCDQVILFNGALHPRPGLTSVSVLNSDYFTWSAIGLTSMYQRHPTTDVSTVTRLIAFAVNDADQVFKFDETNGDTDWVELTEIGTVLTGETPVFAQVGITGVQVSGQSIPAYSSLMFILDGGDRMFKTSGTSNFIWPIGIQEPTALSVAEGSDSSGSYSTGVRYSWAISLCNRLVTPDTASKHDPGLESNAAFTPSNITETYTIVGASVKIEITITVANGNVSAGTEDDFWTHARLYRKAPGETTWKFAGNWNRHADYAMTDDRGTLSDLGSFQYKLTDVGPDASSNPVTLDIGAYDYAPTRNAVPKNMHHFATYRGRSFWANKRKRFVWYSDPVGALTGGHMETVAGDEYLPPLDGPVTLLATFRDSLIIGTQMSLYVMTGDLSSHTNQSIAQDQNLGVFFPDFDRLPVAEGPIYEGTGSHVLVDDKLYFITRRGLEYFDGRKVVDCSVGIRDFWALPLTRNLTLSTLAHDEEYKIVFLLFKDTVGSADANASAIFCYHYAERDPITGLGSWTIWRHHDLNDKGSGNNTDLSAIGMMATTSDWAARTSALMIAKNYLDSGAKHQIMRIVWGYAAPDYQNTDKTWYWESGRINMGLPDRRKHFWFVTIRVGRSTTNPGEVVTVTVSIDGINPVATTYTIPTANLGMTIKVPVGRIGYDMTVKIGGTETLSVTQAMKIIGFDIDWQPLGHY